MNTNSKHPRRRLTAIAAAVVVVAIASIAGSALASSHPARTAQAEPKPTIVLVDGGWADASCWNS
jgi:hypothetical protein